MKVTKTNKTYERIEHTKGRYFFHFDAHEEGGVITCQEQDFREKPTEAQLRAVVDKYYNAICEKKILEGMRFNGLQIWLSIENQTNYALAYSIARSADGSTLPYRIKGYDEEGVGKYIEIESVEAFTEFITAMQRHIDVCVTECWKRKDAELQNE